MGNPLGSDKLRNDACPGRSGMPCQSCTETPAKRESLCQKKGKVKHNRISLVPPMIQVLPISLKAKRIQKVFGWPCGGYASCTCGNTSGSQILYIQELLESRAAQQGFHGGQKCFRIHKSLQGCHWMPFFYSTLSNHHPCTQKTRACQKRYIFNSLHTYCKLSSKGRISGLWDVPQDSSL